MSANKSDLKEAVQQWADRIGVKVREIHLRHMRRKWASISTNGRLTLNTDLLSLPEALTEFVIVHELVHLLVPNHGKLFKGYMSAYLPDWEDRQDRLRLLY
ncbi:M48 family metallopeptidase [Candidatus Poribacteria bacterium]|nr:M48 family metallopeptidase [Candidatus Poribacteria bacterium]MYG06132.1 M48 family metallopeptidase [Candidatus Poribacteria bacterium]MYK23465.1 M48 family metallopeptidase [Candidatus Poribacteria bacterium]